MHKIERGNAHTRDIKQYSNDGKLTTENSSTTEERETYDTQKNEGPEILKFEVRSTRNGAQRKNKQTIIIINLYGKHSVARLACLDVERLDTSSVVESLDYDSMLDCLAPRIVLLIISL